MDKQFSEIGSTSSSSEIEMQTVTLNALIEKYVPEDKHVDVLSIDVEGHDFEVLKSLDLNIHKPTMIVIEDLSHQKTPFKDNLFNNYLIKYNYSLVSKDSFNLYFMKTAFFDLVLYENNPLPRIHIQKIVR